MSDGQRDDTTMAGTAADDKAADGLAIKGSEEAETGLGRTDVVVVSVGTDHHPFERLVGWAADWATDNPGAKVIVQRGTARPPAGIESHELIPHDELRSLFAQATAVVSHGGPSTIMDARMAGRFPIVVARDPALGEHVDEHQLRFADHLERHGLAQVARDEESFRRMLVAVLANPLEYTIPADDLAASAGVLRFGQVVDALLGIQTTLRLDELKN